jgi:hypothetical protein
VARDSFTGYKTDQELVRAKTELYRMKITECLGFPYSIRLVKGYPYMITSNIGVDDGLVNGAIGTLKYIEHLTGEEEVIEETDVDGYGKITDGTVVVRIRFETRRGQSENQGETLCHLQRRRVERRLDSDQTTQRTYRTGPR